MLPNSSESHFQLRSKASSSSFLLQCAGIDSRNNIKIETPHSRNPILKPTFRVRLCMLISNFDDGYRKSEHLDCALRADQVPVGGK
jgi:hypothetical protein